MQALKKNLDKVKGLWVEKLLETLWVYRTSHKNSIGETLFQLAFGAEVVIPVEIGLLSFKVSHFEKKENEEQLCTNLNLIKEAREEVIKKEESYKRKATKYYNKRVNNRHF